MADGRRGAAECLVVNELGDGRVLAAEGALGVAPELEFAELHVQRVEQEQAVEERSALAEDELQNLGGLDEADDAGQHAEHAALGAARDRAGRRRFGIEAAIARPAQVRREDAGLAFEAEDGAIHVRLPEQHAGVVGEVAGGEVVRAVHDDVVGADDVEGVLAGEAGVVQDDLDVRVEAADGVRGGLGLGPANVRGAVDDLALEVGEVHRVEIHDAEFADARGGQVHRDGRAEPARADAEHAGGANFLLALQPHFGQNQMPRVAADFVVV